MTEHEKAKAWRNALGMTQPQLAARIGYSREAVFWFEAGKTPPGRARNRAIKDWVWQRYKLACAGLDAEIKGETKFNWK